MQHTITRTVLDNGKYSYEVDGETIVESSKVLYTHASLIQLTSKPAHQDDCQLGDVIAFLHKREDLAVKGSSDAKRMTRPGTGWERVPGAFEISEVTS